jgi:hypothetical protein
MPNAAEGAGTVSLDNDGAFADVDPGAESIPVAISGTVAAGAEGEEIAIGLNGRVAATTWLYDSVDGTARFEARVPPGALRPGRNEVAVGTIGPGGAVTALTLE